MKLNIPTSDKSEIINANPQNITVEDAFDKCFENNKGGLQGLHYYELYDKHIHHLNDTCFGKRDVINFIALLHKYPTDEDEIIQMMVDFYKHTDYTKQIVNFIKGIKK